MKKRSPKIEQLLKHKTILKKIALVFKGQCMYSAAKSFLRDVDIHISTGTLCKFYQKYCPACYQVHFGYGTGRNVKKNRINTDRFVDARTKEVYVKTLSGKWMKEYVYKMEDQLKADRKVLKQVNSDTDLVVHHKNFNHLDNRKSNLKVMSRVEHSRLHMLKLLKGKTI